MYDRIIGAVVDLSKKHSLEVTLRTFKFDAINKALNENKRDIGKTARALKMARKELVAIVSSREFLTRKYKA